MHNIQMPKIIYKCVFYRCILLFLKSLQMTVSLYFITVKLQPDSKGNMRFINPKN